MGAYSRNYSNNHGMYHNYIYLLDVSTAMRQHTSAPHITKFTKTPETLVSHKKEVWIIPDTTPESLKAGAHEPRVAGRRSV